MTVYLLDTSAVVDFIRGREPNVRRRIESEHARASLVLSSVVHYELAYGVEKSPRREKDEISLTLFLSGGVVLRDYDFPAAVETARIRRELERIGRRIGHYDLLIAGHARAYGWAVVTSNRDEFERVPDLLWEDWRA